jgi:hypothetical protein
VRAAALIAGTKDPGPAAKPDEGEGDEDDEGAAGGAEDEGEGGKGREGDGAEDEDEGAAAADAPLVSVDDAAKKLGLTREQFNALTVQVGGDSLTLGQLKAKLPEIARLDKARNELDDERGTWELERIASYRNLTAIIDALPKNAMTAGLLRQLEVQHENNRAREMETLHFARPRWQDATYAAAARVKIHAVAKEYGFTRAEVDGLMDHRQVLLVQDYAELRERVRASRDTARKLAEGSAERPAGQKGAAAPGALSNGTGRERRAQKPTQETIAKSAGSIMRRR